MGFVEKKFLDHESCERGFALNVGLQFAESSAFTFTARQRDVRMVGARVVRETAKFSGGSNALFERKQFRGKPNAGKENSGAIKEAQFLKPHWNRRRMYLEKMLDQERVFLLGSISKEFERNVPRFGRRPT